MVQFYKLKSHKHTHQKIKHSHSSTLPNLLVVYHLNTSNHSWVTRHNADLISGNL